MQTKTNNKRARPNAGRKPKPNKENWGQITCVLRRDTIRLLREGAGSNRFGEFLQAHLERHPLPSREEYELLKTEPAPFRKWEFVRQPTPTELLRFRKKHGRKKADRKLASDLLRKAGKS